MVSFFEMAEKMIPASLILTMDNNTRFILERTLEYLTVNELVRGKIYLVNRAACNLFVARYSAARANRARLFTLTTKMMNNDETGALTRGNFKYRYMPKWLKTGDIIRVTDRDILFWAKLDAAGPIYGNIEATEAYHDDTFEYDMIKRGKFIDIMKMPGDEKFYSGIFKFRPNWIDMNDWSCEVISTPADRDAAYLATHKETGKKIIIICHRDKVDRHFRKISDEWNGVVYDAYRSM